MPYQPLVVVLAGVAAGIVVDRDFGLAMPVWLAAGIGVWIAWLALWKSRRNRLAAPAIMIAVAAVGGAWHHAYWHFFRANEIGRFAGETPAPICIEAIASAGPRRFPPPPSDPLRPPEPNNRTRLPVQVTRIRFGEEWQSASGNGLLLIEGDLLGVHAGDRLQIFGRISAPSPAGNPGEQDLAELARGRRQLAAVRTNYPQSISVIDPAHGWSLVRGIEDLRTRGHLLLSHALSPEHAALAEAVLLGSRDELDPQRIDDFVQTGTIHIVVVAGLHVGILAYLLFKALRTGWIARKPALIAVVVITGMYALVTDAEPPVLRATAVVWIVCGSLWLGRGGLGLNSLALAGLAVLALNPTELFRTGTQLSFLAVAAVIAFERVWSRRPSLDPLDRLIAETRRWPVKLLKRIGHELRIVTLVGATIWLVALPLVMAQFHLVTPAALVVNPLLMLPVTLAMISGFGLLLFGWLLPPLGALFGTVCNWSLGVLSWSISTTASAPASHFWVPGPRGWWLAVFYIGLAWIVLRGRRGVPARRNDETKTDEGGRMKDELERSAYWPSTRRWRWTLLAAWCGVGFGVAWLAGRPNGQLDCTFVSVGHGCGVVVELPDGRVMVSDAGRLGSPLLGAREVSEYLWSRGRTHIDAIVISHNDTDHFNAVPELLRRFSVGAVYVSPVMFNRGTGALGYLRESIAAARVPLRETSLGDHFMVSGGARVRVLHPPPQGMGTTENADSILLEIVAAGRRLLLTGDLASPGLDAVVGIMADPFDAIMIPHHGSATSNPALFAAWSKPHWAIISGDLAHDSRIAVAAYQRSGAIVLNTATAGAVHIGVAPDGAIRLDCFRRGDRW
jgi:competence protein ComEC